MIDTLVQFSHGVCVSFAFPIEQVFAYNVRFQILCDTDEQRDYLWAMQFMYGREVDIRTWETWHKQKQMRALQCHYDHSAQPLELLPIYFTTSVQRHD